VRTPQPEALVFSRETFVNRVVVALVDNVDHHEPVLDAVNDAVFSYILAAEAGIAF
jgi:hypothetical protein